MSVVAGIRSLLAQGFSIEQALIAAEAFEEAALAAVPRSSGAERTRRWRERKASQNVTERHGDVTVTASSPKKDHSTPFSSPPRETPKGVPLGAPKGATAGSVTRGTFLAEDWQPADEPWRFAVDTLGSVDRARQQLASFRDYWRGRAGAAGRKRDWDATWRNWVRRSSERPQPRGHDPPLFINPMNRIAAEFMGFGNDGSIEGDDEGRPGAWPSGTDRGGSGPGGAGGPELLDLRPSGQG